MARNKRPDVIYITDTIHLPSVHKWRIRTRVYKDGTRITKRRKKITKRTIKFRRALRLRGGH